MSVDDKIRALEERIAHLETLVKSVVMEEHTLKARTLYLTDDKGRLRMNATASPAGAGDNSFCVYLYDHEHRIRSAWVVDHQAHHFFSLLNKNEKKQISLVATDGGEASVAIYDEEGNLRATVGSSWVEGSSGEKMQKLPSSIVLSDPYGRILFDAGTAPGARATSVLELLGKIGDALKSEK